MLSEIVFINKKLFNNCLHLFEMIAFDNAVNGYARFSSLFNTATVVN